MRLLIVGAAAALGLAGASAATLPPYALRNGFVENPATAVHIPGADVPWQPLAEWEVVNKSDKSVQIVWGADAVAKAPANAVRYRQKTFTFPTGTIRVLEFKKAQGGVLHAITMETQLFMLGGSATVEVAGKTEQLKAGDAVNYPSGVLRGSGDATVLLWNVTGTANAEASKALLIRARDAKTTDSAEWDANGKRVRASTKAELAKAPKDAIRLSVTRYPFEGNSIRVAHSKKGGPTSPATAGMDALIYVTGGKLRFFHNDQPTEAVPGDALREVAGDKHYWYRIEDSSFVAISSLPVAGMKAGPATDR
jgi:quercetin dioxygenase-like cupin family protein